MDLDASMLKALKDNDLVSLRSEVINCLDDDMMGDDEPQTLKLATYLDEQLGGKLFVPDNCHVDFLSVPLTRETFRNIKSRLSMNFSKEKVEFASRIITTLHQKTAPAPATPTKQVSVSTATSFPATVVPVPTSTVKVKSESANPSQMAAKPTPPPSQPASPAPRTSVSASSATWPDMPETPKAEKPQSNGTTTRTQSTGKSTNSTTGNGGSRSMPIKVDTHTPKFFEKLFGRAGRKIDDFLQTLFGK